MTATTGTHYLSHFLLCRLKGSSPVTFGCPFFEGPAAAGIKTIRGGFQDDGEW